MAPSHEWYQLTKEDIAQGLNVQFTRGLGQKEALKRREEVGENRIAEGKRISPFVLFVNQFKDFMVLILLIATLISGLLGEHADAITIIAIVMLNAFLGFFQEFRAERSLQALKQLTSPTALVLRGGEWGRVPAAELVPGDVVAIENGDRIPADVRFLDVYSLKVEESALTGESVPVEKHNRPISGEEVPLGDRRNMGFLGTMVVGGKAVAVVVNTGMQTEMGKIADLLDSAQAMETPLQRKLEQLGKTLIVIALLATVAVVVVGIWQGHDSYSMFLAGVSLAVAAIPEGLPAIVTVALAIGVQRMIKRKAIVRKLPSVETLGCASVICSDKTGTLTQNKMTVTRLWTGGKVFAVTGQGYDTEGQFLWKNRPVDLRRFPDLRRMLQIGVLCNDARLVKAAASGIARKKRLNQTGDWSVDGDPTEGALLVVGAKAGWYAGSLAQTWRRIAEIPFDSERKRMSVLFQTGEGKQFVYAKGAPDVLLERCSHVLWDGGVRPLTPELKRQILTANESLAGMALRNLAFAYREVNGRLPDGAQGQQQGLQQEQQQVWEQRQQQGQPQIQQGGQLQKEQQWGQRQGPQSEQQQGQQLDGLEKNLVFVGLMGMIDPPREEVRDAIATCYEAGIKTVMITGDHQTTAVAIARQLGILPRHGQVVNGSDLDRMTGEQLAQHVDNIYVYARVSPEHKLKIVQALQARGEVVAMTGDGVNDAPAIKTADIGIAMGITGTDVSKEASSLVLSDDNFATIVAAVEEGRGIYDNIRKFIRYLLGSNVGEMLVMFVAMLLSLPLPLVPIQILWVNLVTDGLPAMALGVDPQEGDTMRKRPRDSRENVFARGLGWKIVSRGTLIGLCTLGAFWLTYHENPGNLVRAQTVAFATLVVAQLVHVFDCRSEISVFHRNIFENTYLLVAVASSALLMLGVMYYAPLQPIFNTTDIGWREWSLILVSSAIPTIIAGILPNIRHRPRTPRSLDREVA
ncbi:cation-translocating P-type ATPase [Numidum massiliense]|uniref:cation-translocating P-type ATPase n=1 Tax=Numidum massiliense TaxID=1522315 RepID=UPI0006D5A564|nr:cation-translocating P-type ATPase [Numidum massiliense]